MKIAFIGQKGIPATFGGVESHVDELAHRLAQRHHDVSVYVRSWYTQPNMQRLEDIRLVHTPTVRTKHLDALVHSFTSSFHSLSQNYDIVHYHAIGPTFFSCMPALFRKKVVATVHRLDWQAEKWGKTAKALLKLSERTALHVPAATIAVSKDLQNYLQKKYKKTVFYIPNGVKVSNSVLPAMIAKKYGLKGKDYLLFLGRFVPEKRVDLLIRGFKAVHGHSGMQDLKLVLAGGSSATDQYMARLVAQAEGSRDIIFTGYVTGQEKAELLSNALLFLLPSDLEGHPIALLEAMGHGLTCFVSNIPAHSEVVVDGISGFMFQSGQLDDMVAKMNELLRRPRSSFVRVGETAQRHVQQNYDWEQVVDRLEDVYRAVSTNTAL
jgi:glycosyltransferase involved in cell wall biosynthesis